MEQQCALQGWGLGGQFHYVAEAQVAGFIST
jgi:hypothetical protein